MPPHAGGGSLATRGRSKRSSLGHAGGDSASTGGARGPGFTKASAFRNVFTRTQAACDFQEGQPGRSPKPARRAQPGTGGAGSPPRPRWLEARSLASSLPTGLWGLSLGPCTRGSDARRAEVGKRAPKAAKKYPRASQRSPRGGGGASEDSYPHEVTPGRRAEISLLSLPRWLTSVPTAWPPPASPPRTCPRWAGMERAGHVPAHRRVWSKAPRLETPRSKAKDNRSK